MTDPDNWWIAGDPETGVLIDGQRGLVTPGQVLLVVRHYEREIDRLKRLYKDAVLDCEDACELDCDGHGGKASACRRCPRHPLRKGDPAEAIASYLR